MKAQTSQNNQSNLGEKKIREIVLPDFKAEWLKGVALTERGAQPSERELSTPK